MFKRYLPSLLFLIITILSISSLIAQDSKLIVDQLLEKGLRFKNRNSDSVNFYTYKAYQIAKKNEDYNSVLNALSTLIRSNIKSGNLVRAQNLCDTANSIVEENSLVHRKAEVLINQGNVYQMTGLTKEALNRFFDAQQNIQASYSDQDEPYLLFQIALSYYNLGDAQKSIDYARLSIATAKNNNLLKDLFAPYLLLSNSFSTLDSIQKYLTLSDNLVKLFPDLIFEKVTLLNNQALLNKSVGNYKTSKAQYLQAIGIAKQNGFQNYLSNLYNNYAYQLMSERNFDSAYIVLRLSLTIAKELNNMDLIASIYDSYSDYFSAIKRFETSLAYKDSSIVSRREYRDQQRIQESLFLSVVFETEQKEKELLKQENQINQLWVFALSILAFFVAAIGLGVYLKQKLSLSKSKLESVERAKALGIAEALIQGQDAERKRLAMDLHDGPVANIGVLRFMVDGFFQNHAKYGEVIESIKSINRQVREISHRMLPAHIQEQGLILTIQNMIDALNKSGKFTVEFDSNILNRLPDKLELNIYYLIYELINNATKHSNGDSIFVQLFELEKSINLSVEDNGQGFDPTIVNDGIGLRNIKTRIDYLGGKLEIISDEQTTLFIIEIPTFNS